MRALNPLQQLVSRIRGNRPALSLAALQRRELRLGIGGLVVVVLALVASAALYVLPLGEHTYTAELAETGAIRAGDNVRVAGVPVGTVKSLDLHEDHVSMEFTVNDAVFIGDQTTLDIRMLTIAGGYYLAVLPAGESPLGDNAIPPNRVRVPYSLAQAVQDAAQPIADVDGDTLRQNFAAVQNAIVTSPDALRRLGTAIDGLVDILDRQNADVSRTLSIADEYVAAIDTSKSELGRLVTKIGLLETVVMDKRSEMFEAISLVNSVLARIAALEPSWRSTLAPMAQKLADAIPELQRLGDRLGGAVTSARDLLDHIHGLVSPDGNVVIDQSSSTTTDAPGHVCIPVPGRSC